VELKWQEEWLLPGASEYCEADHALRNALTQIGVDPM
jgi:hypothetical protein